MTQYIVELRTGDRLTVHRLNDEVRARPIAVGDRVTLFWAAEQSFVIGAADAVGRTLEQGMEARRLPDDPKVEAQ
jgi:hypothetical protein